MKTGVNDFYNQLAEDYHLIFEEWDHSVRRQAESLNRLIQARTHRPAAEISLLDSACGIGTQAIGLALLGYNVYATDLSEKAVKRAEWEATRLEASLNFGVADFRNLDEKIHSPFDVIICCDNALPHMLDENDLQLALRSMQKVLKPGGLLVASIRDYDALLQDRPRATMPMVIDGADGRRVVFQVWDWEAAGRIYQLNLFIVRELEKRWATTHHSTAYRAVLRAELAGALEDLGFGELEWHMPEVTGYHQPLITARKA